MGETRKKQRKAGDGRGQHPNSKANLEKGKWKPGESGNPAGKPEGAKHRATILSKWLGVTVDLKNLPPGTPAQQGTVEDQIALSLISKAVKGDVPAIKEVQDSVYGKMTERTDLTIREEDLDAVIARELERIASASEDTDAGAIEANARESEKGV